MRLPEQGHRWPESGRVACGQWPTILEAAAFSSALEREWPPVQSRVDRQPEYLAQATRERRGPCSYYSSAAPMHKAVPPSPQHYQEPDETQRPFPACSDQWIRQSVHPGGEVRKPLPIRSRKRILSTQPQPKASPINGRVKLDTE